MIFFRNILSAIALLCLCACSNSGTDLPAIAVSVEPQRYLLEQLAADNFKVVTLMKPGSNPETFEPTMDTRVALDHAAAYFYVGGLPFESKLIESASGVPAFDVSDGIVPLFGTHSHNHDHDGDRHTEEADPHVWTSVANARIMARNMARGLIKLDPADSAVYSRRLARLEQRLDSLDNAIAARLSHASTKSFMVWHPSLGYFARDYGLNQLSVGWEAKEPSAAAIRRAIDKARQHGVKVFYYQREFDTRQSQALTEQLGLRTVTIDPLSYDWPTQLNLIADELVR